jgi:CRP-like cAMP-binding protein
MIVNAGASGEQQGDQPDRLDLVGHLQGSDLFGDLSPVQLRRLARLSNVVSFKRNDHVFREGDTGDSFFLVLDGAVRISRQVPGMGEEALAILRPGSGFGEMALIDEAPRSADAIAHERCKLLVLRKEDLEDLLFVDRLMESDILWKLIRILVARLRETNDKMTFLSVTGRFE